MIHCFFIRISVVFPILQNLINFWLFSFLILVEIWAKNCQWLADLELLQCWWKHCVDRFPEIYSLEIFTSLISQSVTKDDALRTIMKGSGDGGGLPGEKNWKTYDSIDHPDKHPCCSFSPNRKIYPRTSPLNLIFRPSSFMSYHYLFFTLYIVTVPFIGAISYIERFNLLVCCVSICFWSS